MMSAPQYQHPDPHQHHPTAHGAPDEIIWQRMCDYVCRLSKQHGQSSLTRNNTIALMARMRDSGISQEEIWAALWLSSKLFEPVETQLSAYKLKRRHQVHRHVMANTEFHVFERCHYQVDARFESFESYIELLIECIHTPNEQDQDIIRQELLTLTDPITCLIHISGSSTFLASYPHDTLAASVVICVFHMLLMEYGHIMNVSLTSLRTLTHSAITCFAHLIHTSRHMSTPVYYPDMRMYSPDHEMNMSGTSDDTHGLSNLVMSTPHEITTLKHGIIKYANAMMETALGRDLYDQMELKIE